MINDSYIISVVANLNEGIWALRIIENDSGNLGNQGIVPGRTILSIPSSAKGDCKIKYAFVGEKRVEHILDQYLKIGAHGELLRVYFIVDKDRKKIIIGSLPNHLEC